MNLVKYFKFLLLLVAPLVRIAGDDVIGNYDLQSLRLKGHVKVMTEEIHSTVNEVSPLNTGDAEIKARYEFDEQGKISKKTIWTMDGKQKVYITSNYDAKNNLIELAFNAGSPSQSFIEYTYNDQGNIIEAAHLFYNREIQCVYKYDSKGKAYDGTVYKIVKYGTGKGWVPQLDVHWTSMHDEAGNIIESDYTSTDSVQNARWICRYDKQNRLIEEDNYALYPDSVLRSRNTYDYDKEGNKHVLNYNGWPDVTKGLSYSIYNMLGNITEDGQVDKQGNYQKLGAYKYDAKNNMVEAEGYNSAGAMIISTYTYKYDSTGNWIEEKYVLDGKLQNVITRAIEYY